jgi:hypothetical protein
MYRQSGYAFVPFSVESYRRFGKPAMKLLRDLGDEAAWPGRVMLASFVAGALHESSIGLIWGNHFMYLTRCAWRLRSLLLC